MNTNTTSRRGRYSARAAAIATTAIIFGAAACGTETGSDIGEPAAPAAPAAQAPPAPHSPTSADAAERQGAAAELGAAAQAQEQYLRHLRDSIQQQRQLPHPGREIPLT